MTDTTVNDSLKNVCKVKELIKTFMDVEDSPHRDLLKLSLELLEKTEEILVTKTQ